MKNNILFLTAGMLLGLIVGFMFANSYNRGARPGAAATGGAEPASTPASPDSELSPEEIKAKIAEADAAPGNIAFQRSLGLALYAYGASKEDANLVGEALRLLDRVYKKDAKDRDVLIAIGNGHFDIGYFKKDDSSFERARDYYRLALAQKPDDPNVIVDVGLTFALTTRPDLPKAVEQYDAALAVNPKHERTLQMMTDAQIQLGDKTKAGEFLRRLREANSGNPMIAEFEAKIAAK